VETAALGGFGLSLADTSKMKGRNDVIVIALILMVITRLMQRSVIAFAPDGEQAAGSDPPAGSSSLHRRPKGPVWWHGKTPSYAREARPRFEDRGGLKAIGRPGGTGLFKTPFDRVVRTIAALSSAFYVPSCHAKGE